LHKLLGESGFLLTFKRRRGGRTEVLTLREKKLLTIGRKADADAGPEKKYGGNIIDDMSKGNGWTTRKGASSSLGKGSS